MKIFAIGSGIPRGSHSEPGVTAVHIVLNELVTALAQLGHEIVFQTLFNEYREKSELSPSEGDELRRLAEIGIRTLPPMYTTVYRRAGGGPSGAGRVSRMAQIFGGADLEGFYPAVALRDAMMERVRSDRIDAILTIWSPEGVAATHGIGDVPRIAYHGDIDFIPALVRTRDRNLFDGGAVARGIIRTTLVRAYQRLWLARFKRAHLKLMQRPDVIANVTACNAEYYTAEGHKRSVYVGNVWYDSDNTERPFPRDTMPSQGVSNRSVKIIGHVGKLGQTGSTYGLRFLLEDLLPALERVMDGLDYKIHIIGAGQVVPFLRPMLSHPRILLRGFVEDLDNELRSSDVFLLLNNAGSYQAAYTRHVVAWAQGLCLIVHENSRRAIPEIRHMENALVASTPADIARLVRLAVSDPELNLRMRNGGRATYERYFTPEVVAKAVAAEIDWAMSRGRER